MWTGPLDRSLAVELAVKLVLKYRPFNIYENTNKSVMPCSHLPVRQFGVIGRLILATCQTSNRSSQVLKQTDYECINFTAVFQFASEIVISKSSSCCLNKCFKEASDWPLDVILLKSLTSGSIVQTFISPRVLLVVRIFFDILVDT